MNLSRTVWRRYISRLRKINSKAAEMMKRYIDVHGISDRNKLIKYANALVAKYGEASTAAACEIYDEIAEMQKARVPTAEPASIPEYAEIAKAVNGSLKQSSIGAMIPSAVSRMVKQTGADTMLKNAKRDKVYFAWIPNGDTCPYCMALAALGWQKAGDKTIKGDHASHIHANCDCTYMIDHKGDMTIEGYNPDEYLEKLREATGDYELDNDSMIKMVGHNAKKNNNYEYLNKIRRENYAANKDKINAQKRAAYANRKEAEQNKDNLAQ